MDHTNAFIYATNKDEAVTLVNKAKIVFIVPRFGHEEVYVRIMKTEAIRLIEKNWCNDVNGGTFARLSRSQGYLFLG